MNDNENKMNEQIKLPVRYDADTDRLVDADGDSVAKLEVTTPNGHVLDYAEWIANRKEQANQIVTALNEADALRAERDDLAMFVRRFLGSKFVPHCELAVKATDYLQRKGLQGSLLRDAAIKPNAAAGEEGTE